MKSNPAVYKIRAKKDPKSEYQRAHDRYKLELDIGLSLLIPEESFEPYRLEAKTGDVSGRGIRVIIEDLERALYARLLSRTRYVRVESNNPVSGEAFNLTGRVAWIDCHKIKASRISGPCHLGISFDEQSDEDFEAYTRFIEKIEAA